MILFKLYARVRERGMILLVLTKFGLPGFQLPMFIHQNEPGQPMLLRGLQLKPGVRSGQVEDIRAQDGLGVVRENKDGKLLKQVRDGQRGCP